MTSSRSTVNITSLLRNQLSAQSFQGCVGLVDYLLGFRFQGGDISSTCVVQLIVANFEHGLEAVVATSIALLRGKELS